MYDVIVVGGGPAGLSAALVLGRCRRRVLVCDEGQPRNAAARALHGYLTRDGIPPQELLRLGRTELRRYPGVEFRQAGVRKAGRGDGCFDVTLADGERLRCRKLIIATGLVDELPPVAGAPELYGRGVFHCPYCDGWEVRDAPLAVYGRGEDGAKTALELVGWSRDVVLCTDGAADLPAPDRERLALHGIAVREERVARLEGRDGALERIVFAEGPPLPRRALFFKSAWRQHCDLVNQLGCTCTPKGAVETGDYESTNVCGLYVAGDAAEEGGLAIIAAAEGARAALAVNTALLRDDLARAEVDARAAPC